MLREIENSTLNAESNLEPQVDNEIVSYYHSILGQFSKDRVGNAILEKWMDDPAGLEGFYRLQAMIDLYDQGARLNHMHEVDFYTGGRTSDAYYRNVRKRRKGVT